MSRERGEQSVSAGADAGFPGRGKIEAIGNQGEILQGWSTRKGKRPPPRVKCIRDWEYYKGQDRRDEWPTKGVSVDPELECLPGRIPTDAGQFHHGMVQEGWPASLHHNSPGGPAVSVLGMAPSSMPHRPSPVTDSKLHKEKFHICDRCDRAQR